MQYVVTQKYTRQSPRKVRLVANTIKDLSVEDAVKQLAVMNRRSTIVVLKTLRQAIANALHNHQAQLSDLTLKEITVNEGPRYRRFRAVSRGRAHGVIKRTSHLRIVLEDTKKATDTKKKVAQPVTKVEATPVATPTVVEQQAAQAKKAQGTGKVSANTAAKPARMNAVVKKAGNK